MSLLLTKRSKMNASHRSVSRPAFLTLESRGGEPTERCFYFFHRVKILLTLFKFQSKVEAEENQMVVIFSCTQCTFSAEHRSNPDLFHYFRRQVVADVNVKLASHHTAASKATGEETCPGSLTLIHIDDSPFPANRPGAWI